MSTTLRLSDHRPQKTFRKTSTRLEQAAHKNNTNGFPV